MRQRNAIVVATRGKILHLEYRASFGGDHIFTLLRVEWTEHAAKLSLGWVILDRLFLYKENLDRHEYLVNSGFSRKPPCVYRTVSTAGINFVVPFYRRYCC
jgi:hypothetical protein